MIDTSLLQEFIGEAEEHLEEMESFLLQLESGSSPKEILNDIFRCIHTIKGASEFVGLERISGFSHKLENMLDDLREGRTELNEQIITFLINGRDRIDQLVNELDAHGEEQSEVDDLLVQMDQLKTGKIDAAETAAPSDEAVTPQLDTLLLDEADEATPDLLTGESLPGYPVNMEAPDDPIDEIEIEQPSEEKASDPSAVSFADPNTLLLNDDDTYDEENDSELFNIFLEQLTDKLAAVDSRVQMIDDDNAPELYKQCRTDITSLRSSANYMGYEKLMTFLDLWIASVDSSLSAFEQGEPISTEYMGQYAGQLRRRFLDGGTDRSVDQAVVSDSDPDEDKATAPEVLALDTVGTEEPESGADDDAARSLKDKLSRAFDLFRSEPGSAPTPNPSDDLDQVLFENRTMQMSESADDDTRPLSDAMTGEKPLASEPLPESEFADADNIAADDSSSPSIIESAENKEAPGSKETPAPDGDQSDPPATAYPPAPETGATKVGKKNMRVETEKIDALMNQVGELVVGRSWFSQLVIEMRELHQQLKESSLLEPQEMKLVKGLATKVGEATSSLGRVVNDLQDGVMKIRMLPIAQLFNRYPRLVRDLVLNTGKNVRLEIKGEETELDKMIIEQMSDPLIHIIRNAVDHGIENAAERKKAGKPEEGRLELNAYHESNHVVIEIVDDGCGIDPKRICQVARQRKFMSDPELDHMSDKELVGLIMKPGFSTAESVTHTSGRGVGMDVVKKNIEKLNGTIEIDSKIGIETRLKIKIPLTLAIISALLVKVGLKSFAIPLGAVEETLRIFYQQIATVEGFEVIHLRNRTLPLLKLSEMFDIPSEVSKDEKAYVVIVSAGQRRIGLLVDSLIGQEEVVIKPLADYLQEDSTFSGATILGDGKISLIIDVEGLVNMAVRRHTLSRSGPLVFDIKSVKAAPSSEMPVHEVSN